MYTLKTFSFVGGEYVERELVAKDVITGCVLLEWALNLEYLLHNQETLNLLLRFDEMGLPVPYRVRMPGYEDQPPTYLTFTHTP